MVAAGELRTRLTRLPAQRALTANNLACVPEGCDRQADLLILKGLPVN